MHISKFKLKNYKSYLDSGDLILNEGINIITGQNNAGKTALLQGLSLRFHCVPHRSSATLPTAISKPSNKSEAFIEFAISKENLLVYIFEHFTQIILPEIKGGQGIDEYVNRNFTIRHLKDINYLQCTVINGGISSATLNGVEQITGNHYSFSVNRELKSLVFKGSTSGENTYITIARLLTDRMYSFQAERFSLGACSIGTSKILTSNASNLPQVLNNLQPDKKRFERYIKSVQKIFPNIMDISVRVIDDNQVEIDIWNEDPKFERSDLVVPLNECGTGIGQVLAILYVVLTSDISKVILIDEPNSFLHPGASRKLIEILKAHPQHQFIIATHSPSTIAASNPRTINIIKNMNAQSNIESIDVSEVNSQQLYLAEIGSKLSDVFGADNILWVEGKTEEICFPKIVEKTPEIYLMGTSILSVINTGDINGKNSDLIFDIYKKLSNGSGLMPSALAFIFDSEKITSKEKEDLERKSNGNMFFIRRRMFENYLLNPKAILYVLSNIKEYNNSNLNLKLIEDYLENNKWDKKFILQKYVSLGKKEEDWLLHVDGAKLLDKLFTDITETLVKFDKIKHSVALCEWIIENSIVDLKEIQDLLRDLLCE